MLGGQRTARHGVKRGERFLIARGRQRRGGHGHGDRDRRRHRAGRSRQAAFAALAHGHPGVGGLDHRRRGGRLPPGLFRSLGVLRRLDAKWFVLAVAAEVASLLAFAFSRRRLLHRQAAGPSRRAMTEITCAASAISMSLPFAGTGLATVYSYRQFRRRGIDSATTGWALSRFPASTRPPRWPCCWWPGPARAGKWRGPGTSRAPRGAPDRADGPARRPGP